MELDDYTTAYPGLSATRDYLPEMPCFICTIQDRFFLISLETRPEFDE